MAKKSRIRSGAKEYLTCLLEGDSAAAAQLINDLLLENMQPSKIYLDVIMPAQFRLGELWYKKKITVAQEHLGSQISITQLSRLQPLMRAAQRLGSKAVIAVIENEYHDIGARVVADHLSMDGWDIEFLGANTPTRDLLDYVLQNQIALLGLSLTLKKGLKEARVAVKLLQEKAPQLKIIAGGPPHIAKELRDARLSIAGIGKNALDAMRIARHAKGLPGSPAAFQHQLASTGRRIARMRNASNLTQQELAARTGLDRGFICEVEAGKQNLSLLALHKIADALNLSLEELFSTSELSV